MSDKYPNNSEVDIDVIMEKIREEVQKRRMKISVSSPHDEQPEPEKPFTHFAEISGIISSAETYADIGLREPKMLQFRGLTRRLAIFIGKKILYLSTFITTKQRYFNTSIIHALNKLTAHLQTSSRDIGLLRDDHKKIKDTTDEIRNQLHRLESDSQSTADEFRNQLHRLESDSQSRVNDIMKQLSQTVTVLNEEIFKREARTADLKNIITGIKYTITMLERRLSILMEKADTLLPDTHQAKENILEDKDRMLDALYVSFEDTFRGTRKDIKERVKIYLPYIKEVNAGTKDLPIIDLGCGRGEWLELLKENGFNARGVDSNFVLVKECRERKLDVIESDVIRYLMSLSDSSIGAITGFHIIEHLPFETLIGLIDETVRVLKAGGIAIFETPNPQNILVGSCTFYLDPTHRNPLPDATIKFIAEARGLSDIEIRHLHPVNQVKRFADSELAERLNEYFYGPQDYAVIGYKR